jgi:hypothetical protein
MARKGGKKASGDSALATPSRDAQQVCSSSPVYPRFSVCRAAIFDRDSKKNARGARDRSLAGV